MSKPTDPQITFGIEFEFILSTYEDGERDPHPSDHKPGCSPLTDVKNHLAIKKEQAAQFRDNDFHDCGGAAETIANKLFQSGIPAFPWFRDKNSKYKTTPANLKGWQVMTDPSNDKISKFRSTEIFLGMEIVSLVLCTSTDDPVKDEAIFLEITRVLEVLRTQFRTSVNDTCGLHVNVDHKAQGFSLENLQNLMAFFYSFEPGIENLHPRQRRDEKAHFCFPLRRNLHPKFKASGPAAIDYTMSQSSVLELVGTMNGPQGVISGRSAYNCANLILALRDNDEGKQTIEFRQHKGTLSSEGVVLWAKFVTHIVDTIGNANQEAIRFICVSEMERQTGREKRFRTLPEICGTLSFEEGRDSEVWKQLGPVDGWEGRRLWLPCSRVVRRSIPSWHSASQQTAQV